MSTKWRAGRGKSEKSSSVRNREDFLSSASITPVLILCDNIINLINHPEKRKLISEKARKYATMNLCQNKVLTAFEKLLQSTVKARSTSGN